MYTSTSARGKVKNSFTGKPLFEKENLKKLSVNPIHNDSRWTPNEGLPQKLKQQ